MSNYKDFKKMYEDWVESAKNAFQEVVPPIMTESHKEAIVMEVYMKYDPTWYNGSVYDFMDRRYGDNGLLDEHNFEYEIDINKNSIVITLYNQTKGNSHVPNNQSNIFIDKIIIEGNNYSWKNSGIAKSKMQRDFYSLTERIMESDSVKKKIIKEFKERGIYII